MKRTLALAAILPLWVFTLLSFNLFAEDAPAGKVLPKQAGTGTVDRYMAHGNEVYRFVPTDKTLRMVKFVPGQLGYKGNKLPAEYESLLATALAEKKTIYFECEYFDHGAGKTAIGKKIIVLRIEEKK